MRRILCSTSLFALAAAAVLSATPAAAQATGDTDAPAADAQQGVGEILVTATRRSENLQDIPLSVATINDETLAAINSGGADIRGLSGRVPSLNIESSFGRTFPRFYIRGLGNTDFDLNASQPVSLVYDEVVLENPILKGFPAFDVDRIEVLRGPQGTLYGAGNDAGTVRYITAQPNVGEFGGSAEVDTRILRQTQRLAGGEVHGERDEGRARVVEDLAGDRAVDGLRRHLGRKTPEERRQQQTHHGSQPSSCTRHVGLQRGGSPGRGEVPRGRTSLW